MLKKGDAVIHPNHGAGVLEDTQVWQVSGEQREYHCIELVSGRGTLFVPTDSAGESGLLPIPDDSGPIISALLDAPQALSDDYQLRKAELAARVHSGDPLLLAGVLRDLTWRERESRLSDGDSQLKGEALALLAGVLALQLSFDFEAAAHQLNTILHRAALDGAQAGAAR